MTDLGREVRVVVFASLMALPACKQILGLHERSEVVASRDAEASETGPTPVSGKCAPLAHPSQTCADCMDQSCCAQATSCHDDPACKPAFDCLFECGNDGACRARCAQFYNRGNTLIELDACREKSCAAACGLSCGGFGYVVPGCDACVQNKCCGAAAACAKNIECQKLDLCRTNCLGGSTSCPPACNDQFPGGAADYQPWLDCVQNTCATECQTGHGWQCLDAPPLWPKPTSLGNFTFSMTIVDLLTENPYAGSTVRACKRVDLTCASPLDQGTTDANGLVSLTVPAGSVGFDGYIEISGGDNGTDAGAGSAIYPALWYPVPPYIASGWRGRLQFVSTNDLVLLGLVTGAPIDPSRGHFASAAVDCNFASAGGVSFTADYDASDTTIKKFYFVKSFPSTSATETDPESAIGGYVNLPAKALLVKAFAAAAGNKPMGQQNFNIRAGWMTTTSFPPIP